MNFEIVVVVVVDAEDDDEGEDKIWAFDAREQAAHR
jgi:hypothetical protein